MLLSSLSSVKSVGRQLETDRLDGSSMHSVDNTPLLDECPYETHSVILTRSPGFGFGFALSGGIDEPPIENGGDRAVYVSDVLRAGPADGRLRLFDRIISVNGVSLAGVDNATAVGVLRDAGGTVTLVIRRRQSAPSDAHSLQNFPALKTVSITRKSKANDFGLLLGVRLYVKGILPNSPAALARGSARLQEGDVILKLNDISTEDLTLNEARKILEKAKDRLDLTVLPFLYNSLPVSGADLSGDNTSNGNDGIQYDNNSVTSWSLSSLNTRTTNVNGDSSNYSGHTLTGIRQNNNGYGYGNNDKNGSGDNAEVRAVPEMFAQLGENARLVSFCKEGSVGIRLVGGNRSGIYIADVQAGSVAASAGLVSGDHILRVNDCDYRNLTREEAVMHLLQSGKVVNMVVEHHSDNMKFLLGIGDENGLSDGLGGSGGDSFYVRANFDYPAGASSEPGQLLFRHGDILHVTDTLYNGTIGCWFAARLAQNNMEVDRGVIPNLTRAEQMRLVQKRQLLTPSSSESGHTSAFGTLDRASAKLFGKRREPRRAKSLSRDYWESSSSARQDEDASVSDAKRPAYERVRLIEPGSDFRRPVVIYGPVSDLARHRLTTEFPAVFESPVGEPQHPVPSSAGGVPNIPNKVIRLRAIRQVMDRGRHAVLDITPNSVDKLTDSGFHPVVIFIKTSVDQRQYIKDAQQRLGWHSTKSTKKLLTEASRLESTYAHLFSAVVHLTASDQWFVRLRQSIELCQNTAIWVHDTASELARNLGCYPEGTSGNIEIPDFSGNPYVMPSGSNSAGDEDEEDDSSLWKQQLHPFATIRHLRNSHRLSSQQKPLANALNRENGSTTSASAINSCNADAPGSYATLPSRRALPPPPQPPAAVSSTATAAAASTNNSSLSSKQSLSSLGNGRTPSEYANFATIRSPVLTAASVCPQVCALEDTIPYDMKGVADYRASEITAAHESYKTLSNVIAAQTTTAAERTSNGPAASPINSNTQSSLTASQENERVYPSFYADSLSIDQRQTIATYGTLSRPRKPSRSSLLAQTDFRSPIIEAKEIEATTLEDFVTENSSRQSLNNVTVTSAPLVNYAPLTPTQISNATGSNTREQQNNSGSTKPLGFDYSPLSDKMPARHIDSPCQTPPSPSSSNRYASLHLVPRPYRRPQNLLSMLHGDDSHGDGKGHQFIQQVHTLDKTDSRSAIISNRQHVSGAAATSVTAITTVTAPGAHQKNLLQNTERVPSDMSTKLQSTKNVKDAVLSSHTSVAQSPSLDPLVLDTVRASVDYAGGILESKATGVSLHIARGALPPVVRQEVYFRVCSEPGAIAALQQSNRNSEEHAVTPVVMCGPPGLVFRRQVELRLPRAVRLKLSTQPPICLGPVDVDQVMSVFIDHF